MGMKEGNQLKISKSIFLVPVVYVVTIWFIYWVEIQFNFNFNKLGVYPRSLSGFKGVFLTHFIHSNASHLFNNSIPLFVLLTSLFYFYKEVALRVLLFGGFFYRVFNLVYCSRILSYRCKRNCVFVV